MKEQTKVFKHYKKTNTKKLFTNRNETPAQKEARIQLSQYQTECCYGKVQRAKIGTKRPRVGYMVGQV